MKSVIALGIILIGLIAGTVFLSDKIVKPPPAGREGVAYTNLSVSIEEYPNLAARLSERINEISPTAARDEIGWLAQRISFVPSKPLAYLEYTDTRVALKLLLEYYYQDDELRTRVLATFIPDEYGDWDLQFGNDLGQNLPAVHYIFNGDSNQWTPVDQ